MATMTERDKKTIRLASYALAAYLVLFYGVKFMRHLEDTRTEYQRLVLDARVLQQQFETYETKALVIEKLRGDSGLDLTKVPIQSLVGETGAAIQKAAQSSGIKLGPIRESAGNASAGEVGSMQMEGAGPIQSVIRFLDALDGLGYPLIINSVQFGAEQRQPGLLKVNLDMVIIDFTRWQEQKRKKNA